MLGLSTSLCSWLAELLLVLVPVYSLAWSLFISPRCPPLRHEEPWCLSPVSCTPSATHWQDGSASHVSSFQQIQALLRLPGASLWLSSALHHLSYLQVVATYLSLHDGYSHKDAVKKLLKSLKSFTIHHKTPNMSMQERSSTLLRNSMNSTASLHSEDWRSSAPLQTAKERSSPSCSCGVISF